MNEPSVNPVWVGLLCAARCVIPLLLLLGVSYLVRKLGLVAEPPSPPPDEMPESNNVSEGGFINGSL